MIRLAILLLAGTPSAVLQAPTTATRTIRDVAMSADGGRIAWFGATGAGDSRPDGIVIGEVRGATAPKRLMTWPGANERDLAWSPDGKQLAFIATAAGGQASVYVARVAEGAIRRLTTIGGLVATPEWSPDGRRLAFLSIEHALKGAGPLAAAARDTGVIGRSVDYQRIVIADLATGSVRRVSPPALYVHEYHWSPDGTRFVAAAGPGPGDAGWYVDEIHVIDVATGADRSLGKPGMQVASPVWSPDGTRIAYLGGLLSDEVAAGGDIWVVSADGGPPRNLTPTIRVSPSWLAWPTPAKTILYTAWANGGTAVGAVDAESGEIVRQWWGGESLKAVNGIYLGSMAMSRDGSVTAVIRSSFEHPPELWVGPPGQWRPFTHINERLHPTWGNAQSIAWKSDSFDVQGWLLIPREQARQQSRQSRSPMVVLVHGGPAAAHSSHWLDERNATELALLERGYYVFMPNPRGSQGFGQTFVRANVRDFGYGDLRDITRGVDAVVRSSPVDSAAVGITGWSYGGYMTMWAITQTGRFRAAVAGAGIANWLSWWAQNGIPDFLLGYFGASVYDDPPAYARSSPITYIKQARTPTLLLVGERDIETPAAQSFEFWKGLKHNGVETELVVYADEGHGVVRPAHVRDRIDRTVAWFDKYLRDKPQP